MLATSLTGKIHFLLDNVLNNDCQNVACPDNTLAVLTEHPQLYAARRRASLVLGDALVDARVSDPDGGELEGPRPLHAVPRPVGRQRLAVLPPRDARLRQAERLALEGGARVDGGGHLRQAVLDGRRHCVKGEVGRGGRVETGRDC